MKLHLKIGFAAAVVCGGLSLAPTAFADAPGPVIQADQHLTQDLTSGNKTAAAALLDHDFEFTNTDGKTLDKAKTLDDLSGVTTAGPGSTDVQAFNDGDVGYVIGVHQNTRFLRVWVKRGNGWKAFNYLETPLAAPKPLAPGGGDCDNPCKTLPYQPTTAMDKAILKAWQQAKNAEWHPDEAAWARTIADEFLIINSVTARPKSERVAILKRQEAKHEMGPPGDPIHSIRMYDFGDKAAVMLSQHTPYHGGKPYYNVRVWILRDGRWQLVVSQQTTIQSAAPVPAVHS